MKRKVLVVDDNDDILDLFEIILCKDYDVITANNGFEGLKKAIHEIPCLIITDIMMPVMDGIRFFNEIQKQDELARVPIMAVTTFTGKYPVKSLLSMGFHAVVPKPFTKDDVLPNVVRLLEENV